MEFKARPQRMIDSAKMWLLTTSLYPNQSHELRKNSRAGPFATSLAFLSVALLVAMSDDARCVRAQDQKPVISQTQDIDVIRTSTALVTVPVSVFDRGGKFVPELKREQFRLFENGIEQQIAYFEDAEQPFTVVLMLDVSDSTKFRLKDIQNAAAAFVDKLHPADRVILVTFNRHVTIPAENVQSHNEVKAAIYQTRSGGGTGLYNAIDMVINQRLNQISGRKAIVVFTDGVDTSSLKATFESTLHDVADLDALIYAIQYSPYGNSSGTGTTSPLLNVVTARGEPLSVAYARGTRYMRLLADESGGEFFYADTTARLQNTFVRVAAQLRQQYSLGFYPKQNAGVSEKRELKVRVNIPHVSVRARKQYTLGRHE